MDRPGTKEEKFEIMKNRLIAKGKWNADEEQRLHAVLDMPVEEKTVEEIINPPKVEEVKKTRTRRRRK